MPYFTKLLPLMALLWACKPAAPISETKSLDDFVDQTHGPVDPHNVCGVPYDSSGGKAALAKLPEYVQALADGNFIKASTTYKDEVLGTLAAVPGPLLAPFLLAEGRIVVSSSVKAAEELCANATVTPEEQKLNGGRAINTCWLEAPARIVLPPDAKSIRHGLLRAVAYFYTEYFVDRASLGEKPFDKPQWKRELAAFRDTREALRDAFLLDVELKDPKAYNMFISKLGKDQLANYVYAEALDSYYCSSSKQAKSPRATFKSRFNAAWKVFTDAKNLNSPISLFGK